MSALYCVVRESDGKVIGLSAHSFTGALEDADEAPDVLDGIAEWFNGQRKPGDIITGVARGGYRFELQNALESLQPHAPGVVDAARKALAIGMSATTYNLRSFGMVEAEGGTGYYCRADRMGDINALLTAALSVDGRDG